MIKYGPWKIWNGGECPVADGVRGQVQDATDERVHASERNPFELVRLASKFKHTGSGGDIIAYREVIEEGVNQAMVMEGEEFRFGHASRYVGARQFTITVCGDIIKAEWADDA